MRMFEPKRVFKLPEKLTARQAEAIALTLDKYLWLLGSMSPVNQLEEFYLRFETDKLKILLACLKGEHGVDL